MLKVTQTESTLDTFRHLKATAIEPSVTSIYTITVTMTVTTCHSPEQGPLHLQVDEFPQETVPSETSGSETHW